MSKAARVIPGSDVSDLVDLRSAINAQLAALNHRRKRLITAFGMIFGPATAADNAASGEAPISAPTPAQPKVTRTISAAGRKKIAIAQKKRWALKKAAEAAAAAKGAKKPAKTMGATG